MVVNLFFIIFADSLYVSIINIIVTVLRVGSAVLRLSLKNVNLQKSSFKKEITYTLCQGSVSHFVNKIGPNDMEDQQNRKEAVEDVIGWKHFNDLWCLNSRTNRYLHYSPRKNQVNQVNL